MFPFTVRQLEVFLAVCEAGSFRRAADRLGISEPGVSKHMQALEHRTGGRLFLRRRGASVRLSAEGRSFRDRAQRFIDSGRALGGAPDRPPARRLLRFHVGPHLLEDCVRPALPELARAHPELELRFELEGAGGSMRKTAGNPRVDGALLTVRAAEALPDSIGLSNVEGAIYGSGPLLARMRREGLAALPFILLTPPDDPEGEGQRARLRRLAVAEPRIAARVQHHDVAVRMALDGQGAILALRSIVDVYDPGGQLRILQPLPSWQRRLYLRPGLPSEVREALIAFFRAAVQAFDERCRAIERS